MTFVLCIIGILLQMLQVQNWYLYSLSFNILEIIINTKVIIPEIKTRFLLLKKF